MAPGAESGRSACGNRRVSRRQTATTAAADPATCTRSSVVPEWGALTASHHHEPDWSMPASPTSSIASSG